MLPLQVWSSRRTQLQEQIEWVIDIFRMVQNDFIIQLFKSHVHIVRVWKSLQYGFIRTLLILSKSQLHKKWKINSENLNLKLSRQNFFILVKIDFESTERQSIRFLHNSRILNIRKVWVNSLGIDGSKPLQCCSTQNTRCIRQTMFLCYSKKCLSNINLICLSKHDTQSQRPIKLVTNGAHIYKITKILT